MTVSLRTRLFVGQVLLLVAALATVTAVETREQRRWLLQQNRESLERMAPLVAQQLLPGHSRAAGVVADWPALAATAGASFGERVTLIDRTGVVRGDSDVPRQRLASLENHAGRPEVRRALAGRSGWALRRSASIGVDLLYVAIPAPAALASEGIAVVRVAEPMASIARVDAALLRLSVAAASLTLIGMTLLAFWITGRYAARVRELERSAERLGAGDPTARAREIPRDSLGRLGHAINHMAQELRARLTALERERNEREQIVAHMLDGVALLDGDGRVLHSNRSLAAILGLATAAAPGTPFAEYVREPMLHDLVQRARAERGTAEGDVRFWTPEPRFAHAIATSLGGSGAVLLAVHDLTEMESLHRVRQDFVANVSHELRTPLTSIRGYAETLMEGGFEDVEHREAFVRIIRDQALRLESLVADLLSLAELERKDAPLRRQAFDLREALERQVAAACDRARRAGLALTLEPGPPIVVEADRGRLDDVIANLLDNALKYTERGGVTARLGVREGRAWCEVADTGPGIPPAEQARVFERFYRVDKARSRAAGGTGLGLAIVKHAIALHGGEVTLRSEPGHGSVFRFEIPVSSDPVIVDLGHSRSDPPGVLTSR